jgi:Beta-propeller repeat
MASTMLASGGSSDIFVTRLDTAGDFLWAKKLGGAWQDEGRGIAVDAVGNAYITGHISVLNGSQVEFAVNVSSLDAAGNLQWSCQLGHYMGFDVALDSSSNVYVTGRSDGGEQCRRN